VMRKQERVDGTLRPPEEIEVCFRARPYSVSMKWRQGAGDADRVLYVEGENDGKMLAHPTGLAGRIKKVVALDPDSPHVRRSGRYDIREFGLRKTLERTLADWKASRDRGTLRAEYLGTRQLVPAGDRPCYTLRRTDPQTDGEEILEATVFIDEETWFQVGTVL